MAQNDTNSIEVVAPVATVDIYHEVLTGIQTGSYAVLLAIAVVYVMTRKAIGTAWTKHFNMLDHLKETQASNAKSLKLIADSNKRIADLMSDPRMLTSPDAASSIKHELTVAQATLEVELESVKPET